jgi:mannose-6-phosphate isomerase-like protein (cupin superfamily)
MRFNLDEGINLLKASSNLTELDKEKTMLAEQTITLKDESFALGPGEGKLLTSPRGTMLIRVRGEDTGGAWAAVEASVAPRTGGPPLHINTREDEMFYVLSGTLRVQLGERTIDASAGSLTFVPRGSVHTFCNPFDEPVRFLGIISPAGFEKYFEDEAEVAESTPPGAPPDVARLMALAQSYGGVVVGPPMDVSIDDRR